MIQYNLYIYLFISYFPTFSLFRMQLEPNSDPSYTSRYTLRLILKLLYLHVLQSFIFSYNNIGIITFQKVNTKYYNVWNNLPTVRKRTCRIILSDNKTRRTCGDNNMWSSGRRTFVFFYFFLLSVDTSVFQRSQLILCSTRAYNYLVTGRPSYKIYFIVFISFFGLTRKVRLTLYSHCIIPVLSPM